MRLAGAIIALAGMLAEPAVARHGYLRIHHHHWQGVCSVFSHHPCTPTVCSVFHRGPCIPEIEYPIGEDLQLIVVTAADAESGDASGNPAVHAGRPATPNEKLNTIGDVFNALRACWIPPPESEARANMQMSVRFSLKSNGALIASPRVTYKSPEASVETINNYHDAITAALERCTPLPLSERLGNAIAGRPIAVRFIDERKRE